MPALVKIKIHIFFLNKVPFVVRELGLTSHNDEESTLSKSQRRICKNVSHWSLSYGESFTRGVTLVQQVRLVYTSKGNRFIPCCCSRPTLSIHIDIAWTSCYCNCWASTCVKEWWVEGREMKVMSITNKKPSHSTKVILCDLILKYFYRNRQIF